MRLWVPHLFIILNNFDDERWTKDRAPTMREMLDRRMSVPAKDYLNCPDFDSICLTVRRKSIFEFEIAVWKFFLLTKVFIFQWKINAVIYQNSAIIALSAVTFSFLVGTITTSKFRKKAIMRKVLIFINYSLPCIVDLWWNWAKFILNDNLKIIIWNNFDWYLKNNLFLLIVNYNFERY